jgi:hypothetical protein
MQIEEEFRDIKSSLFGLDFEHQKAGMGSVLQCSSSSSPLAILLVGLQRRYQMSTVKNKQVLSFHYLG